MKNTSERRFLWPDNSAISGFPKEYCCALMLFLNSSICVYSWTDEFEKGNVRGCYVSHFISWACAMCNDNRVQCWTGTRRWCISLLPIPHQRGRAVLSRSSLATFSGTIYAATIFTPLWVGLELSYVRLTCSFFFFITTIIITVAQIIFLFFSFCLKLFTLSH